MAHGMSVGCDYKGLWSQNGCLRGCQRRREVHKMWGEPAFHGPWSTRTNHASNWYAFILFYTKTCG